MSKVLIYKMPYSLAITEYYLPQRHGYNNSLLRSQYIIMMQRFVRSRRENSYRPIDVSSYIRYYIGWKQSLMAVLTKTINHPTIRNIQQIIEKERFVELNIVDYETLDDGYCVCTLKTFWLRIFQKRYKKRFLYLKKQREFKTIMNREIGI